MNTTDALILGSFVAIPATSAFGQEQLPEDARTNHRFGASSASVAPEPDNGGSRPLVRIGGLPVHVYTAVEPQYDPATKRNLAAVPLWCQLSSRQQGDNIAIQCEMGRAACWMQRSRAENQGFRV
jgi:hypothetical protein